MKPSPFGSVDLILPRAVAGGGQASRSGDAGHQEDSSQELGHTASQEPHRKHQLVRRQKEKLRNEGRSLPCCSSRKKGAGRGKQALAWLV